MKHATARDIVSARRVLDGEINVSHDVGYNMIRKRSIARGSYVSSDPSIA